MSNHIYFSPFPNGFRPQIGVISRVISCPSCISTALFRSRSSHARSRGSIQMQRCPAADTTGSHSSLSVSTGCPCYWTKTAKNMCANASVRVYLQVSWFIYSLGTPHFANTPTLNIVGYISIYIYVDIYIYIYIPVYSIKTSHMFPIYCWLYPSISPWVKWNLVNTAIKLIKWWKCLHPITFGEWNQSYPVAWSSY
jgi:hypothetical protein